MSTTFPTRDPGLDFGPEVVLAWHPTMPELSFAANSISMLMPYVEPFIARSVRQTLPDLDPALRASTESFIRQELSHHVQHRRFNDQLAEQCPGLRRVERWMRASYGWLARKRSRRFNVAFAAGSEAGAFGIARWVDHHVALLFDDADEATARLFLWHLAEEVEHKSAAFDVFEATDGSRLRLAAATALSMSMLVLFTFAGCLAMLRRTHRLHLPVAWFRLARWSISLAFAFLPTLAVSCLPGHHPRVMSDPPYLTQYLRGLGGAHR